MPELPTLKNVRVNVVGWLRAHTCQADGLLAAALLAVSAPQVLWFGAASGPTRAAFAVVTVVLAATVLVRRRYPVAAFGVAAAIEAAQVTFGMQYAEAARRSRCGRPTPTSRSWCCCIPWPRTGRGGSPSPR